MSETASARAQQRRRATVVFADISGFTAMSEKLDPEEVTEIVDGCFRMVERVVLDHGGTVDKFIGDCVMALFGASHAIESAARHAVEASLAIRSGLERFNQERQLPIRLGVHIGVNTGIVIAGDVGGDRKRDFTVMGDTVNLAARLEDASGDGQIFVGANTYADTRRDFDFRALAPLALKGKAEAVQAYEVIGAREPRRDAVLGRYGRDLSSPLVGRDEELCKLEAHVERFRHGQGGAISIIGEAGIGKSRLLAELVRLPALQDALVLVGRSDSIASRQAFHPFVDLLRSWAEIDAANDEETAVEKLERAVARVISPSDDVLPFVATLMGFRPRGAADARLRGIEGDALENLLLKAMADLLAAIAARDRLVLVFEDLHWADPSSVRLLESVHRVAVHSAVLFVHVLRPAFTDTTDRLLAAVRGRALAHNLELFLDRLSESQSLALVRNLTRIERVPAEIRALAVTKAEGNPLFIEEVIRSLIDQGAIEHRSGGLAVTEKIASVTVPGTLQEVITVRVEQLDPASRRVLERAAVIGRAFLYEVLERIADPEIDLERALHVLEEREVVQDRPPRRARQARGSRVDAERELVFRHALIQEAVYESLLLRERRLLHLRVAEAVEHLFAERLEEFYGFLAFHYTRAERLDLAERYLFLAGEEAARSAASGEALRYFREASRIYDLLHGAGDDPQKRFRIERNLATALLLTGNLTEARPHFDRALEHLGERVTRTRGQAIRQLCADLARILFRVYVMRGRMPRKPSTPEQREALGLLYNRARAESVAGYAEWFLYDSLYMTGRLTTIDPTTVEQSFAQWAGVALLFSYSGLSFDLSRRVSEIARRLLRPERKGDLLTYRLMNFMRDYFEGRWNEPSGVDDALISEVLRQGLLWDVDTFLGMDAEKQIDQGNFSAAQERMRTITMLVEAYGYGFAETNQTAMAAYLALEQRRLDDALELVERYEQRPEESLNLVALGTKAEILLLKGDRARAEHAIRCGERLLTSMGRAAPYHRGRFETSRLAASLVALEDDVLASDRRRIRQLRREAARNARSALRTASALARIRTQTYCLLGTYHSLIGHPRRALDWWRRCVSEGKRLGARAALGRSYVEIATRLGASASRVEALDGRTREQILAEATRLFEELQLGWDLARCNERRAAHATG